jgi:hypothetical protein
MQRRIGTVTYPGLENKDVLRSQVLSTCRAAIVISGDAGTMQEARIAQRLAFRSYPWRYGRHCAESVCILDLALGIA